MADQVFNTVQTNTCNRKVVADIYLSLKAYAVAASDALNNYATKGKDRNLASIGDLLSSIEDLTQGSAVRRWLVFSAASQLRLIKSPVNRINFIGDEYYTTL
jgi:hypothetical protein